MFWITCWKIRSSLLPPTHPQHIFEINAIFNFVWIFLPLLHWAFFGFWLHHSLSWFRINHGLPGDFADGSDGKASVYNVGDLGLIPWWGRSPGEGNGNPLQYSCLENPMDGGAWCATVHGVTKSRTLLSNFTSWASQVALAVKKLTCQCRRNKRYRFNPSVRNIPIGEHGSPLQYSCLENPIDRGAWCYSP